MVRKRFRLVAIICLLASTPAIAGWVEQNLWGYGSITLQLSQCLDSHREFAATSFRNFLALSHQTGCDCPIGDPKATNVVFAPRYENGQNHYWRVGKQKTWQPTAGENWQPVKVEYQASGSAGGKISGQCISCLGIPVYNRSFSQAYVSSAIVTSSGGNAGIQVSMTASRHFTQGLSALASAISLPPSLSVAPLIEGSTLSCTYEATDNTGPFPYNRTWIANVLTSGFVPRLETITYYTTALARVEYNSNYAHAEARHDISTHHILVTPL